MKRNDYDFLHIGVPHGQNSSPTPESHGRNGNVQWEFSGVRTYKMNTTGKKGGEGNCSVVA